VPRDVRAVGGIALVLILFAMITTGDVCDVIGALLLIGAVVTFLK
jgi:hypothetical protein